MHTECIPYKRKALYLLLTIPIIILYLVIMGYLWKINTIVFGIYVSLFALSILFQSYCCEYQSCPYIGKFCPGIGGFIVPASVVALLLKNIKRSKMLFDLFALLAFICLLGIVIVPVYFIYKLKMSFLIFYLSIVIGYSVLFLAFICPACATRDTCPAGKVSSKISRLN